MIRMPDYERVLQILRFLGIIPIILGSIVATVITVFWEMPTRSVLTVILGLLVSLGIYQCAAIALMERHIQDLSREKLSGELGQPQWYIELMPSVLKARNRIDITHHQPVVPIESKIKEKKNLFETISKTIKECPRIRVRWIIAVSSKDKIPWVESLIEDHKMCDNFSVAYSKVDLRYQTPPLSVQLIDESKVFVIDMGKGFHTESEWDIDFSSTDPVIVSQFQRYYDTYWSRCTKLKEGPRIFFDRIRELKEEFGMS